MRPVTLDDFIGQEQIKRELKLLVGSANARGTVVEHTLFSGPPGLGKTTLAGVIAKANSDIGGLEEPREPVTSNGPQLQSPKDAVSLLIALQPGDTWFIDEIHRMSKTVEEVLYQAMEDNAIDVTLKRGNAVKSTKLELPPFTLVGATTRTGLLSQPLLDRFGYHAKLEYYSPAELATICQAELSRLGFTAVQPMTLLDLGKRARGTPRVALKLCRRVRDYVIGHLEGEDDTLTLRQSDLDATCEILGIDPDGLEATDRAILKALEEAYPDPIGLGTLSALVGEDQTSIENTYEPYLLRQGFMLKTTQGRLWQPQEDRIKTNIASGRWSVA